MASVLFDKFGFSRCFLRSDISNDNTVPLPDLPFHIQSQASSSGDPLFWQFPCITEKAADALHPQPWLRPWKTFKTADGLTLPRITNAPSANVYIGLPWATFIDRQQWPETVLTLVRQRLHSLKLAFMLQGTALKIHTVCQHIFWERYLSVFKRMGITDLHVPHLPEAYFSASEESDVRLHPWTLYAVNAEDPARQAGLDIGRPISQRSLTASFIGAHDNTYLSPVRDLLRRFEARKAWHIEITGRRWHFESAVYGQQVKGEALAEQTRLQADMAVEHYNRLLCDSRFALCPSGTGPNSLRLWEALAVGCIPVMLGVRPALPRCPQVQLEGVPRRIEWADILLKCDDKDLDSLPQRLESMPVAELVQRQKLGMAVWKALRERRCFE